MRSPHGGVASESYKDGHRASACEEAQSTYRLPPRQGRLVDSSKEQHGRLPKADTCPKRRGSFRTNRRRARAEAARMRASAHSTARPLGTCLPLPPTPLCLRVIVSVGCYLSCSLQRYPFPCTRPSPCRTGEGCRCSAARRQNTPGASPRAANATRSLPSSSPGHAGATTVVRLIRPPPAPRPADTPWWRAHARSRRVLLLPLVLRLPGPDAAAGTGERGERSEQHEWVRPYACVRVLHRDVAK